jgi:hypothetical protein
MASEKINSVAKVPGVLKVNEDTREEMMRRIYWKDRQYLQYGSGLAEYVTIKDRSVSPITGGKSLVDFTHDGKSDYSKSIDRKYKLYEDEAYEVEPLGEDLQMWEGDYLINFTERNKLSEVGDLMYAQGMTFMNYANSDRHVKEKYLTPDLTAFYGTSPIAERDIRRFSIFAKGGLIDAYNNLSGEYKRASGRIPDIPEAQVEIVHDYVTGEPDLEHNGGNYYLEEQLSKSIGYKPDKIGGRMRYADLEMSQPVGELEEYYGRKYEEGNSNSANEPHEYHEYDRENIGEETRIEGFETNFTGNNLLSKTNDLFRAHRISTLMGRFHTSVGENGITDAKEITDTAKSSMYGNSHGRNLLKLKPDKPNGYDNPYCRVWTYHHQYDKVNKLIRPFVNEKGATSIENVQFMNKDIRAHSSLTSKNDTLDGGKYLAENTVLANSGFVNIVPSNDVNNTVAIKKCMFSIENLAWKDVLKNDSNLAPEQRGPNGGRIMWFPPYDLDFQENVTVDWDPNDFIGRGEKVYTYKNTTRTGTLSFTLLIDHPGVIDAIKNKTKYNSEKEDYQAILRYFAGCGTLEDWMTEDVSIEKGEEKDNNSDEGKQVPSEETTKLLKFYVYYPNNYSGNSKKISENEWTVLGNSDEDWYYYLLMGNGTGVDMYGVWNGYETSQHPLGEAKEGTTINPNPYSKDCSQWQLRTETVSGGPYNYRVDFDLRQPLVYQKNYIDNASFKLNSQVNEAVSVGATNSFAEVIVALMLNNQLSDEEKNANGIAAHCNLDMERVEELRKVFNSKIYSMTVKGAATKQDSKVRSGCTVSNDVMLARRRASSISTLLQNALIDNTENEEGVKISDREIIEIPKLKDMTDVNTIDAKSQRYAVVEIEYNAAEITKLSEANNDETNGLSSTISENKEAIVDSMYAEDPQGIITETGMVSVKRDRKVEEQEAPKKPTKEEVALIKNVDYQKLRYETEADYFDKLSTTDPFTFENLKKRFKYFTPAFHSISPEGFNARLTFLQQCTRQGHTIEHSSKIKDYDTPAGNLAFGRMPVCVLRLGDFINTRILINNLTINYQKEGMQWDLNPEGAGVQPMYATVSLGIVILGGQSLSGPISRLQNAVSFNYYANTGVYDNRADRVTIDENGKESYTHLWTPKLENTNVNEEEGK